MKKLSINILLTHLPKAKRHTHTRARYLQKVETCIEELGSASGLEAALTETGSSAPSCLQWVQEEA